MFANAALEELHKEATRIGRLSSALSLMGWDQETGMPAGGRALRAAAMGELTQLVHTMGSSEELGAKIAAAEGVLPKAAESEEEQEHAKALVREMRRSYDRKCKVPASLAEEIARTSSESLASWKEAREKNEFSIFKPYIEKMFALRRQEAEAIGGADDLYDVMLDEWEPGCSGAEIERYIAAVKPTLIELLSSYGPVCAKHGNSALRGRFPIQQQKEFGKLVIETLGFDFERGRVDESAHPFCSGLGAPGDVRLTTRFSEENIERALLGLVHECGHGIYEQGLDNRWQSTPVGEAVSMGIHESQSRLYENNVARGRPFWQFFLPKLKEHFPGEFDSVSVDGFLKAVNHVEASMIRVEADEVTYNLHIMLRFEVERALLSGDLAPQDLPGFWDERMESYLGVRPASNSEGCLQDIHWSFGAIGYFPTYFLGNLYAAQIFRAAHEALPSLDEDISNGVMAPLREWLGKNIHNRGSLHSAPELCKIVTGSDLDPQVFVDYISNKIQTIHGS